MNFTVSAIAVLAAVMCLAWKCIGKTRDWKRAAPFMLAIAATVVRIWLTLDRRLTAEGAAGHDAYLFVWQAAHIIEGLWLGQYDYLTLIKGPFLSIWMAVMFYLGIPFLLSQHLLYAACSALMVQAFRPVIKSHWAAVALYVLLLFNPVTYSIQVAAVVSRMGIYLSLTLGVTACAIGLFLRWDRPLYRKMAWAGGLGVLLGCFLVTREAGIWIAPMLFVLAAACAWRFRRIKASAWAGKMAPVAVAALLAVAVVQGVSYMNWKHYTLWEVTEFGHPSFRAAYGALSRIVAEEELPYVPVTRASRMKAYSVSPAFAELERHLEGDVGMGWAKPGEDLVGLPVERREIAGGWFMWALREAAMWQEYHVWPTKAMAYYQLVADEINTACEAGEIECHPARSAFAPVWRPEWKGELARAFGQSLGVIAGFGAYAASGTRSTGEDWVMEMFSEVSRTRLVPRTREEEVYTSADQLFQFKQRHLDKIADKYQDLGLAMTGLALMALLTSFLLRSRLGRETIAGVAVPMAAILSSLLTYTLILSLIHISSFHVIHVQYLFPGSALLLILIFLCFYLATQLLRGAGPARELDL